MIPVLNTSDILAAVIIDPFHAAGKEIRNKMDNIETGNIYTCPSCTSSFRSYNGLKAHKKNVHQGIRYPCNLCEKVFTTPHALKGHIWLHTPENARMCVKHVVVLTVVVLPLYDTN